MKKLKEKLSAKLSKNGGFTLVEMLIVVAIIAILIAVSIPLVGSTLERAREATDAANERAFKGALVSGYLLSDGGMTEDDMTIIKPSNDTEKNIYVYDAANGKVVEKTKSPTVYGKSKAGAGSSEADCAGKVLYGKVTTAGDVVIQWSSVNTNIADVVAGNLVSDKLMAALDTNDGSGG